jgi:hypothetical protein
MNAHRTTKAKAAKDDEQDSTESSALVADLHELAKEWMQAATRADTLDTEDTRNRGAAQLRFVAVLTASGPGFVPLGSAWLAAGRRMLDTIDAADMDAVHESRSRRRGSRDLHEPDPRGRR